VQRLIRGRLLNMVDHHHIDLRLSSNEALRIANRGRHDPWLAILLLLLQKSTSSSEIDDGQYWLAF
jgi:hypothetical protein